jgi:hypothetical protein
MIDSMRRISYVRGEVADLFLKVELLMSDGVIELHLHHHSFLAYHRVNNRHGLYDRKCT